MADTTSTVTGTATTTTAKPAAKKPATRKPTKRTTAKKPAARKAAPKKPASRVATASKGLGESVFERVNELVAAGQTAKAAFDVVAAERKLTVSNVQQHYYRFKRRAGSTARTATSAAKSTVREASSKATTKVNVAGAKFSAPKLTVPPFASVTPKAVLGALDVPQFASKHVTRIGKDLKVLRKDASKLRTSVALAATDVVSEVRGSLPKTVKSVKKLVRR